MVRSGKYTRNKYEKTTTYSRTDAIRSIKCVRFKGNYSLATLIPRIDTEATSCTAIYKSNKNTTNISWPSMTAGECVIVDLTPPTNKNR